LKELGLDDDPLSADNMNEIARIFEVQDSGLELLEDALTHGIPHNVLNAKYHEKEAIIIAEAGRKGSVTVATNMAGRGVDILLGGNPEYLARQEMAAREWDNDRYLLFEVDEEERAAYETEYEPILSKVREQTD